MKQTRTFRYIVSWALCLLSACYFFSAGVVGDCDLTTEYECSNELCVPRSAVNNSVNDCRDNSDEVPFPCRFPMFSCRNNRCILMDWVLDGRNDCIDSSDEAKVIGTNCTTATKCCFCEEFVPFSECRDELCQCRLGYGSNILGTQCILRILGDSCSDAEDCSNAVENSTCIDGQCRCAAGFKTSSNKTTCIQRHVGDECRLDADCATIRFSSCVNSSCRCSVGYKTTSQIQQQQQQDAPSTDQQLPYIPVQHNQTTSYDDQTDLHTGSDLRTHSKQLNSATYSNTTTAINPRINSPQLLTIVCTPPRVHDPCSTHDDCAGLKGSVCSSALTCQCGVGRQPSTSGRRCRPKRVGDVCDTTLDCLHGVSAHTECDSASKQCRCGEGFVLVAWTGSCTKAPKRLQEEDRLFKSMVLLGLLILMVILSTLSAALVVFLLWRFVCHKSRKRLDRWEGNRMPKSNGTNGVPTDNY